MNSVVLYDGVCKTCQWTVKFIIPRDPDGQFRFANQQSEEWLLKYGVERYAGDSVILIEGERAFVRSTAMLRIASRLRGPVRLLTWLRFIPAPLRDWAYEAFSRNRYRIFGRTQECLIPPPEWRGRFLD